MKLLEAIVVKGIYSINLPRRKAHIARELAKSIGKGGKANVHVHTLL